MLDFRTGHRVAVTDGVDAAKAAKDYCKSLMPGVAKLLHEHKEDTPLFAHYGVEEKLNQLHQKLNQCRPP